MPIPKPKSALSNYHKKEQAIAMCYKAFKDKK